MLTPVQAAVQQEFRLMSGGGWMASKLIAYRWQVRTIRPRDLRDSRPKSLKPGLMLHGTGGHTLEHPNMLCRRSGPQPTCGVAHADTSFDYSANKQTNNS